ncbi:MAG: bifunctional adenosylcobinamide kinase/adenosylcobinamide-phosphate guanylyltransferase [Pirellulales bacterium]
MSVQHSSNDSAPVFKGTITLVLGGVRSGKSRFAQDLAAKLGGDDVLFVATAEPHDGEMQRRILHHRQSRPQAWQTLECPLKVGNAIAEINEVPSVVLMDCLTLLVSNILCESESAIQDVDLLEVRVLTEVDALIDIANHCPTHLIIVSSEVGAGVVPDHLAGRIFRDLLGFANQRFTASATATYWMIAGLAINATELASSIEHSAQQTQHIQAQGAPR